MAGIFGEAFLIAIAVGLLALNLVLRRLPSYLVEGRARQWLRRWIIPSMDLLASLFALFLAATALVARADRIESLVAGALLAGLAWAFRGTAQDFANGIVLRMEGIIDQDAWIALDDVAGRARIVGIRSVELETDGGERIRVPYGRISASKVERSAHRTGSSAHTFHVSVPRNVPLGRVLADLPGHALLSPWSSAARAPEVRLIDETPADHVLEVTAYAIDPAFVSEIEAAVRLGLSRTGGTGLT